MTASANSKIAEPMEPAYGDGSAEDGRLTVPARRATGYPDFQWAVQVDSGRDGECTERRAVMKVQEMIDLRTEITKPTVKSGPCNERADRNKTCEPARRRPYGGIANESKG